ncbi:electron transport complex subunit RsxG [Aurantivibrio infirmus]
MLGNSIGFNSILLGLFALVTAAILAVTNELTADKIVVAKERAAQAALFEIIPRDQHDNDLFADTTPVVSDFVEFLGLQEKSDEQRLIHLARKENQAFAAIIPSVAKDGYSGDIEMIIGINNAGEIAGVRVTSHNETPGLGDYIDVRKSNWIQSFDGKDLHSNFSERQEIILNNQGEAYDQLTGATITRKAVIRQVRKTLSYFDITKPLESE